MNVYHLIFKNEIESDLYSYLSILLLFFLNNAVLFDFLHLELVSIWELHIYMIQNQTIVVLHLRLALAIITTVLTIAVQI